MIYWGTLGLLAGSAGGLLMILLIALKKPIPAFMSKGHGMFNSVCLIVVLVGLFMATSVAQQAWWGAAILVGAMFGGFLFFKVLSPGKAALLLAVGHGVFAAIGLYFLVPVSGLL